MAVISTRTVGVNAAFLQEIKEENRELHDLIGRAVDCFDGLRPRQQCVRVMAKLLEELRDQFSMHFALEEAYGYFADALSVAPPLSDRAEELRNEHSDLFLEICAIAEAAERYLYEHASRRTLERLGRRWTAFHDRFQTHEAREADLMLAAFDDDIGVGD